MLKTLRFAGQDVDLLVSQSVDEGAGLLAAVPGREPRGVRQRAESVPGRRLAQLVAFLPLRLGDRLGEDPLPTLLEDVEHRRSEAIDSLPADTLGDEPALSVQP